MGEKGQPNMKTTQKLLAYSLTAAVMITLCMLPQRAQACSAQPLTYFGGYIDAWDQPQNIYYVFWGFNKYGDPANYAAAANAVYSGASGLATFGIGGTRHFGVPTQYAGTDWNLFAPLSITNQSGNVAQYIYDDNGLPAPDQNGQINLTDDDISNYVDNVFPTDLLDYDSMVVVFLPPNAPSPIGPGYCGQHFASTNNLQPLALIVYGSPTWCINHEVTENADDPVWNLGVNYKGWDQDSSTNCEIGDLCEAGNNQFTVQSQQSSSANSKISAQQFYSNEAVNAGSNGCVYGRSTVADVYGLGSDNTVQDAPIAADTSLAISSAFSWGKPSGVTLAGSPAGTSWAVERKDVFVHDSNGKMYHASSNDSGATVTWESLSSSGKFTQSPDATTWGAGNLQVFGVQNTTIMRDTQDWPNGWSGWKTVAGPKSVTPASKVSVASWGASKVSGGFPSNVNTVVAAFRGSDGKVWLGNSVNNGSFSWKSFSAPAKLTGDVDISAWAPPRLDLFVLDTSGNFWDMSSNDGINIATSTKWNHPSQGGFQVGPGAAGLGDGRLIVGGRVGSSSPFVQLWNWHGTSWVSLGSTFTSGIDIASP